MASRRVFLLVVLLGLLVLPSCGGPATMSRTHGRLIEPPPRIRHPAAWEMTEQAPPAPSMPTRPFADTPITAFAEQIADLALAAVEGRPLPPSPVPTRDAIGTADVEWSPGITPRPRQLTVLAVGLEADLILKRGEPDDADRWGTLRTTIVVNRNGIRIVSLRPGTTPLTAIGGAPPPGLEGLNELSRELIAALRAGDVSAYELTEADRRLLNDEGAWAQIHEDGPPLARAPQVAATLDGLPDRPLAYRLDDIGVLARDEEGRLYALTLELDPRAGSFALATSPLVSVRRLWPHD